MLEAGSIMTYIEIIIQEPIINREGYFLLFIKEHLCKFSCLLGSYITRAYAYEPPITDCLIKILVENLKIRTVVIIQ